MESRLTAREFAEWMAFYQIDPWGEQRADMRSAQLVSMLANINRDPKKGRVYRPDEFMLFPDQQGDSQAETRQQTAARKLREFLTKQEATDG